MCQGSGQGVTAQVSPGADAAARFCGGYVDELNLGEPMARQVGNRPRACGADPDHFPWAGSFLGPSPRLRGRFSRSHADPAGEGSIPAPAGPIGLSPPRTWWMRVHPRTCGADAGGSSPDSGDRGPSPRLRGRSCGDHAGDHPVGSIPAPAGPILVDLRFTCNKDPFSFSRKDLSTMCTVAEPTPPLS